MINLPVFLYMFGVPGFFALSLFQLPQRPNIYMGLIRMLVGLLFVLFTVANYDDHVLTQLYLYASLVITLLGLADLIGGKVQLRTK